MAWLLVHSAHIALKNQDVDVDVSKTQIELVVCGFVNEMQYNKNQNQIILQFSNLVIYFLHLDLGCSEIEIIHSSSSSSSSLNQKIISFSLFFFLFSLPFRAANRK